MFNIGTLNKISPVGLETFPRERYVVGVDPSGADAILVRSTSMHEMAFQKNLLAVARAGAGVNNIPLEVLSGLGIPVFNTPGANSNAVKELVTLALLLSTRPVIAANRWVATLEGDDLAAQCEKGKSSFSGSELKGKTLGVIGLGAIGALVSNLALHFGMKVIGYDPFLSIKSALLLDKNVLVVDNLNALYAGSDYITLHVPETPDTKGMINKTSLSMMRRGVRIINLARGGLVVNADMLAAIESAQVACHVTDFTARDFLGCDKVICFPHLGASTAEAEDNCALMAVEELRDFLERGVIINSVNFPRVTSDNSIPSGGARFCISHKNVPTMLSKFTSVLGQAGINISAMTNGSKGDVAYTIIDTAQAVTGDLLGPIGSIDGVTKTRLISCEQ